MATALGLVLSGCSKSVVIPRDQVMTEQYRKPGSYRIRLAANEDYLVRRFSFTDSTVVIEEMLPSDERYRTRRTELPISVPLASVASISEMKNNWVFIVPALAALTLLAYVVVWEITDDEGGGLEGSGD